LSAASTRPPFAAVRTALAVVIGVRLALSPFAAAVGQPQALWLPRGTGLIVPRPPSVAVVVGLQLLGVAGVVLHLWRRRLTPFVVAWVCLLLLAGVRTSLGKILHNDVLLVLATAPVLLAGRDPDEQEARTGLNAAAVIVLLSYLAAGWWKLLSSGPAWALSDNLRWSLVAGRGGARWSDLAGWLVARPVACIGLACGILTLEAGAFVVWLRPRLAPLFVAAATLMHVGTWLVLGLDYFAHLATVAVVLLGWARMRRVSCRPTSQEGLPTSDPPVGRKTACCDEKTLS